MNENLSVLIALGAGLLSFLSPCVLPLIPSYLCIIGGVPLTGTGAEGGEWKPRLVAGTLCFILGFSAVFIVLSILFAAAFSMAGGLTRHISRISGAVIIILGLNIIFDFLSFLNYEKRFHLTGRVRGTAGAFLAGAAFGAGWTPCVGPVLGSILLMAGQSGGIPMAVLYLSFYSAGMGLPFLLASIFFNAFLKTAQKLRPHLPLIRRISGVLLVLMGILIFTGAYQGLNGLTSQWQNRFFEKGSPEAAPGPAGPAPNPGPDSGNAVSPGVVEAFLAAGLPVVREGIEAIDFTLPLLNGRNQRLSDLKGRVVFLNFWAAWCGPCRQEMPSMEAIYQRLKDRGFEILAVNLREKGAQVSGFMKEYQLSFPAALDESGAAGAAYNVQAIPTTYILDRRGLVVSRVTGSINWDNPRIIAALEALLDG